MTYTIDNSNIPTNLELQRAFLEWLAFTNDNNPQLPTNELKAEKLKNKYDLLVSIKDSYFEWNEFIKKNDLTKDNNFDNATKLYNKYQNLLKIKNQNKIIK
jgi:hypothetical protein